MARVTFIHHGMDVDQEDIRTMAYKVGDPLPVKIIEAAQNEWCGKLGHPADSGHVKPGHSWDHVRVGAQKFSAKQFMEAQQLVSGPGPSIAQAPAAPLDNRPRKLAAAKTIPNWDLL